jgi:hypothetical protein
MGRTVLLVEDNTDGRIICRRALEHFGYTMIEALDGEEAIAYAPNVGTTMPSSGLSPCESAAGPPPAPLASPHRLTAVANAWPTSGPTLNAKTRSAREATSSRHSPGHE